MGKRGKWEVFGADGVPQRRYWFRWQAAFVVAMLDGRSRPGIDAIHDYAQRGEGWF